MAPSPAIKLPDSVMTHTAHRFGLPELNDAAIWLVPRFARCYPHMQNQTVMNFFRSIIDSSEWHFVCSGDPGKPVHAVSLSQRVNEKLSPAPTVREQFTFVKPVAGDDEALRKQYVEEAVALYVEMKKWSFDLGATEVYLKDHYDEKDDPEGAATRLTDVPRELVKAAFGRVFIQEVFFARIGNAAK
jgi:hypothetical protein